MSSVRMRGSPACRATHAAPLRPEAAPSGRTVGRPEAASEFRPRADRRTEADPVRRDHRDVPRTNGGDHHSLRPAPAAAPLFEAALLIGAEAGPDLAQGRLRYVQHRRRPGHRSTARQHAEDFQLAGLHSRFQALAKRRRTRYGRTTTIATGEPKGREATARKRPSPSCKQIPEVLEKKHGEHRLAPCFRHLYAEGSMKIAQAALCRAMRYIWATVCSGQDRCLQNCLRPLILRPIPVPFCATACCPSFG